MILEALCQFSVRLRNIQQSSLYELEVRLGVTRGPLQVRDGEVEPELPLDSHITKCNHLATSLVYLERRCNFIKSLAEEIDRQLKNIGSLGITKSRTSIESSNYYFADIVSNSLCFINNQTSLVLCLQKRSQYLLDVVCYPSSHVGH